MQSGTRDGLLRAAKELIAERGLEATSPAAILARSGAGKGSLYHFFRGKTDLAAAAIGELSAELCSVADRALSADLNPGVDALGRILAFLEAPRNALAGCRIGRLAQEESIARQPALREPVQHYFMHLHELLQSAIAQAQCDGTIDPSLNAAAIGAVVIATLQGAYVYARAFGDASYMGAVVGGIIQLLGVFRGAQSEGSAAYVVGDTISERLK